MNVKVGIIPGVATNKKGQNIDYPDYAKRGEEILSDGQFIDIKVDEKTVSPEQLINIGKDVAEKIFKDINKADYPKAQCVTFYDKNRSITPYCSKIEDFAEAVAEDLKGYLNPFFKDRDFTEGAFL